jgi:DNA repair protein RadA/Sms
MGKSKNKTIFSCQNCGAQRPKWEGRCPECGAWNSLVEEVPLDVTKDRGWLSNVSEGLSSLSDKVVSTPAQRISTSYIELDRVLGGGLIPGSFVLLGGEPGIGKSTLLLQMSDGVARAGRKVLYISGEESVSQTVLRAQRLGLTNQNVKVAAESNLTNILSLIEKEKPDLVIIDSIQTVYLSEITSAPGTVSQVRECAGQLMGVAKNKNTSIFIIGHITKDGNIAGPKVLEHMVDTVLSFDGDPHHQFRLLRALKNRFGAAHELGVFQMDSVGLREVSNPSEMFLEERNAQSIGSSVFCSMEGSRPLLCEVQALTVASPLAMPRRTAIGFDVQRVHMVVAVLDRHTSCDLSHSDIFVNVVGGLKLEEPAADLAVAASLLSSYGHVEIPAKMAFFGEVGLTGEVRAVNFAEKRILEAHRLGFEIFVLPMANKKHLTGIDKKVLSQIVWIQQLSDLPKHLNITPRRKAPAADKAPTLQGNA